MTRKSVVRKAGKWLAVSAGIVAGSYASWAAINWFRYGHPQCPRSTKEADPLLDRFIPDYDVVDRHDVRIAAPAEMSLSAATEVDLERSAVVRGIFKTRELILSSKPDATPRPRAFLAQMKAFGWGVLAEIPGREIVMGGVTQPWKPNPVFQGLPADQFAAFAQPDYVKIAWTLRADPSGPARSVFRTETRAVATDPSARSKFRWYWSFLSPGIVLIRKMSLGLVKKEAERRERSAAHADTTTSRSERKATGA